MESGTLAPVNGLNGDGGGDSNLLNDQPPVDELSLEGTQLQFPSLGGKRPTSSTFKLTGGKVDLGSTSFRKGDTVIVQVVCVVNNVAQVDSHDPQTGIVVSAEQRHSARVTDIRVVEAE